MARELAPHQRKIEPVDIDMERLFRSIEEITRQNQHLLKRMQHSIPTIVDEKLYMQNATLLLLQPQSNNIEIITSIFAIVSSSGASLTLGSRVIPLPIGNTFLPIGQGPDKGGWLLGNNDVRSLTQSTAGILALELSGVELADMGIW